MTMNKYLHPKDDIDCLNVSQDDGERGLTCMVYSENASIRALEDYIRKSTERLITANRNITGDIIINRATISRKVKWTEKKNCTCV